MIVRTEQRYVLKAISDAISECATIHLPHDQVGIVRATILGHLEAARKVASEAEWERQ